MAANERSRDEWIAELRAQATAVWGPSRAAEMDAALTRMAEALYRVSERSPSAETLPYVRASGAGQADDD